MAEREDLAGWIEREYRVAAQEILRSISATGLEQRRPAFGQVIRPVRGSVLASPFPGHYDPEPDYFFHWLRDSAAVIGAVLELIADGTLGDAGHAIVADFVSFSLGLDRLDGRALVPGYDAGVSAEGCKYLRPADELASVAGDRVRMDVRFNPDGSLDIIRWGRPQLDGPAFRGLVMMQYADAYGASPDMAALIDGDVDFTLRHAGADGFDIWEERRGGDYYTRSLQQALLAKAVARASSGARAAVMSAAVERLDGMLNRHWSPASNAYLAAVRDSGSSDRDVDFAVVLAALHGNRTSGSHSVRAPRMQATLATLAGVFAADYAINRARPGAAPAMGRYRGDVYQSGGAFYFSTLGAAEFHYRLAASDVAAACALIARGDAFMETVRRFTPASGELSEQFDQTDGRQTSAPHLAWSYAAFITASAWRRRAIAATADTGRL
jgi:glucoamylase